MTIATIINRGNSEGDELHVRQGDTTHVLRRGWAVDVDAPHGCDSEPIVLRARRSPVPTAGDVKGAYRGKPQILVTYLPAGATRGNP